MSFWKKLLGQQEARTTPITTRKSRKGVATKLGFEGLEQRDVMSATPLPVLLVVADQRDFYFKEYHDTRVALEARGVDVVVAATTTNVTQPHSGSGQDVVGGDGSVVPDIALADVNPDNYSAIAFVGGWGSSMYQYAYNDPNLDGVQDNVYYDGLYNGDASTKQTVNNLINEYIADGKPVAGICHGVSVLAWARVDGVSPLAGKQVSVPLTVGSPNQWYNNDEILYPTEASFLGQYEQAIANGAIANTISGQYGPAAGVEDDVVVDGLIITAENYDTASAFGDEIADQVLAAMPPVEEPVANSAPVVSDASFVIAENSPAGSAVGVVTATDADAGQTLTYAIEAGNDYGVFAINPLTGVITVANANALNFEAISSFELSVSATDNGNPQLSSVGQISVQVLNVYEPAVLHNGDLVLTGTPGRDVFYIWSNSTSNSVSVDINGVSATFTLDKNGRVKVDAGDGDDDIFATDLRIALDANGNAGNDLLVGGSVGDLLDGGDGIDRLWGGLGNDILLGGADTDYLYGREGNNILVGGDGDDILEGFDGDDLLIGGNGADIIRGGAGNDILIGGLTSYDQEVHALDAIFTQWRSPTSMAAKVSTLSSPTANRWLVIGDTVHDDGASDAIVGGAGRDWLFNLASDVLYGVENGDAIAN